MGEQDRIYVMFPDRHIGFGIRWTWSGAFVFELSLAFPFLTVCIGFGRRTA